ncbi:hypothetical protein Droror1_Dr00004662 [Drosera rotundifolia]
MFPSNFVHTISPCTRTRKPVKRSIQIDSIKTKHEGNSLDPSSGMKMLLMHLLFVQRSAKHQIMFGDATQDNYVIEHLEIPRDKFPVVQWQKDDKKYDSFIKHCKDCGNPEIFFGEGMV